MVSTSSSSTTIASRAPTMFRVYERGVGWSFAVGSEYPRRVDWRPTKAWAKRAGARRSTAQARRRGNHPSG